MVYYIEAVGADMLKIGFTDRDPEERLKELQTGNPHRLRLVAYREGGLNEEEFEHERWASQRTSGEWFRIDHRLRWYMNWMEFGFPEIVSMEEMSGSHSNYVESRLNYTQEVAEQADKLLTRVAELLSLLSHRVANLESAARVRESFASDRNRFADCRM